LRKVEAVLDDSTQVKFPLQTSWWTESIPNVILTR